MSSLKITDRKEVPVSFSEKIDELVQKEFARTEKECVHPEVRDIIVKGKGPGKSIKGLPEELYNKYLQQCHNEKKRHLDDDDDDTFFMQEYKRQYPRIDTSRYVPHGTADVNLLGITDSYLKHQELTLSTLLPRTVSNQWIINNDQIQQTAEIVEEMSSQQRKQIHNLEIYRQKLQHRYESSFL
ncbi:hypothetical protein SEUBUCD646_0P03680 [Saccharomyces eubayanus]|uniref:Uncharacterized protein n=1 Tax=Saccharomyces eubayanus TaxID=1080349 RepID=A0ABN8VKV7_SACEU|nr:hypothetical protein SEUBUCD650_0P03690 [Saccharomyces eubayanus]CAI1815606.1 hypothetical protein SEUBUCD646_0P03680 [Saccharomyces eubayanus]